MLDAYFVVAAPLDEGLVLLTPDPPAPLPDGPDFTVPPDFIGLEPSLVAEEPPEVPLVAPAAVPPPAPPAPPAPPPPCAKDDGALSMRAAVIVDMSLIFFTDDPFYVSKVPMASELRSCRRHKRLAVAPAR